MNCKWRGGAKEKQIYGAKVFLSFQERWRQLGVGLCVTVGNISMPWSVEKQLIVSIICDDYYQSPCFWFIFHKVYKPSHWNSSVYQYTGEANIQDFLNEKLQKKPNWRFCFSHQLKFPKLFEFWKYSHY